VAEFRFIVDAQLPPALARWIEKQGNPAIAVRNLKLRDSSDGTIWDHAFETDSVIITKDEDFADRTWRTESGPQIIWLRVGNSGNAYLVDWLTPLWPEIIRKLEMQNRLIEVH